MRVLMCGSESFGDKLRLEKVLRDMDPADVLLCTQGREGHGTDDTVFETADDLGFVVEETQLSGTVDDIAWRNEQFIRKNYDNITLTKAGLCIACCSCIDACEEAKDMADRCRKRGIRFVSVACGF